MANVRKPTRADINKAYKTGGILGVGKLKPVHAAAKKQAAAKAQTTGKAPSKKAMGSNASLASYKYGKKDTRKR